MHPRGPGVFSFGGGCKGVCAGFFLVLLAVLNEFPPSSHQVPKGL
jgi:hypothetical protein